MDRRVTVRWREDGLVLRKAELVVPPASPDTTEAALREQIEASFKIPADRQRLIGADAARPGASATLDVSLSDARPRGPTVDPAGVTTAEPPVVAKRSPGARS